MKRFNVLMVLSVLSLVTFSNVPQARATFHLWLFNEVYSNADGSIQFVEMFTSFNSQQFTVGQKIDATQGGSTNSFIFPANTPSPTAGHHLLLATAGFAALPGVPAPDFTLPDNFLFQPNGTVTLIAIGGDNITYAALPTDGTLSLGADGSTTQVNSPTNYGGQTGSVSLALTDPIPASIDKGTVAIELEVIAQGLVAPVLLVDPNDGNGRLFVVDQAGEIRVIRDGFMLNKPFLDVSDRLVPFGFFGTQNPFTDFDERGLLGLAFHPDFSTPATSGFGKIYTYTSEPVSGAADFTISLDVPPFNHQAVIAEWMVDPNDPNMIDTATRRELLRIDEPQFNHDGGMIAFGPDGFLYLSLGDGGGANDRDFSNGTNGHGATGNGQNKDSILGNILRIDVAGSNGVNGQYGTPGTNPFNGTNGLKEIFAYGFRNPFRFSFDRLTGDLIVADVGQNQVEEINNVVSGGNYGWNLKEGTFRFDPETGSVFEDVSGLPGGLLDPVAQYDHDEGVSVIGGYVYRGSAIAGLAGRYVFGDFSTGFFTPAGRLFHANLGTGEIKEFVLGLDDRALNLFVKGFGQDADGELYLMAGNNLGPFGANGQVFKIVTTACSPGLLHPLPGDTNRDCVVDLLDFAEVSNNWMVVLTGP